ncbi:hypothetical protein [Leptolyngbya sp. 'hensonii']|uniref:hypothetical protein n=1 Tax=Leptolyngbya sp. 'hensonii' TaxID=1922337 RepID=UPI00117EA8F0|nr:hypothetical protein [Leptolyngbya sp. 'hensonii']
MMQSTMTITPATDLANSLMQPAQTPVPGNVDPADLTPAEQEQFNHWYQQWDFFHLRYSSYSGEHPSCHSQCSL